MPLVVGALMVPASVTAFGFSVYGEELETALSSSAAPAFLPGPVPVNDFIEPVRMAPPAPVVVSAAVAQQHVITTRVIVDPVWGPPSDGGPQVDVLVV